VCYRVEVVEDRAHLVERERGACRCPTLSIFECLLLLLTSLEVTCSGEGFLHELVLLL
jgi:hypothetical protein